jgi:hypothetical protein
MTFLPLGVRGMCPAAVPCCCSVLLCRAAQAFHTLYHTDDSVLLGAPTGSGKTISSELTMMRLWEAHPGDKVRVTGDMGRGTCSWVLRMAWGGGFRCSRQLPCIGFCWCWSTVATMTAQCRCTLALRY